MAENWQKLLERVFAPLASWFASNWAKLVVWACVGLTFLICLYALARAAGILGTPVAKPLGYAIGVFGVCLTFVCLVLWVGNVTQVVPLTPGAGKALWITLVASVLPISVAAYQGAFDAENRPCPECPEAPKPPSRVQIDNLVLLQEGATEAFPDELIVRENPLYKGRRAHVLFAAMISGLAASASNRYEFDASVTLENPSMRVAEFERTTKRYSRPDEWADQPAAARIKRLFPNWEGRTAYVGLLSRRADLGRGTFEFHLTVTDSVTGFADHATRPITIE